ncbi:MAG TPA: flagellar motor protein MotB [Vicinamibacterales bacterium]|nr:flagellar motor protein MotB [Vicinamibacterales bacterium]
MNKGQPIIIVKKKRGGHAAHHGGAWKVAYADFVTAMMAFFLVMWLVNQQPAVKAAVAGYFRDPGAFDSTKGGGILPGGAEGLKESGVTPVSKPMPNDVKTAKETLEKAAEHMREALKKIPSLKALEDRIEITVTDEGLRIELLETAKDSFFAVGSADLLPETVQILVVISKELGGLGNAVALEGHTDSRKYAASSYANWELSTDRANSARRAMERFGLQEGQIDAVRGYADTRLRTPDMPLDARNRRISIVVQNGS